MSYTKITQMATTAAFAGCLYAASSNKRNQNFFRVNAEPVTPEQVTPERIEPSYSGFKTDPPGACYRDICKARGFRVPAEPIAGYKTKFPDFDPYEMGPIFPHPEVPSRMIIEYQDFILCYDHNKRLPAWTLEVVLKNSLQDIPDRFPANKPERMIEQEFRSSREDYDTVKHRIKQVLLADPRLHPCDVEDVAKFSNVVPQANGGRGQQVKTIWDRFTEYTLYLASCGKHQKIYILSGTLFLPEIKPSLGKKTVKYERFGKNKVAVPTHFFKVILAKGETGYRLECYKFKNEFSFDLTLSKHLVERDELENDAGLQIFRNVEDHHINLKRTDPFFEPVNTAGKDIFFEPVCSNRAVVEQWMDETLSTKHWLQQFVS